MYDSNLVKPMREELTSAGVTELTTAKAVDDWMKEGKGTALLVVNSVCGCAAGAARPGVRLALGHPKHPDRVATVFAGQDKEATDRARSYFSDFPPTSPSLALFKDGKLVEYIPRHRIEGRDGRAFAADITALFDKHCAG
jgi:putative YphP/YqiW family bacilliredoxin